MVTLESVRQLSQIIVELPIIINLCKHVPEGIHFSLLSPTGDGAVFTQQLGLTHLLSYYYHSLS